MKSQKRIAYIYRMSLRIWVHMRYCITDINKLCDILQEIRKKKSLHTRNEKTSFIDI